MWAVGVIFAELILRVPLFPGLGPLPLLHNTQCAIHIQYALYTHNTHTLLLIDHLPLTTTHCALQPLIYHLPLTTYYLLLSTHTLPANRRV